MPSNRNAYNDLQFTVFVERRKDYAVISFEGELDLFSCDLCRRHLREIATLVDRTILFDLSRLSFVDSAGVSALVETAQRLRPTRTVRFVIPRRGAVRRAFELLSLDDSIPIDAQLARAIARCGRRRARDVVPRFEIRRSH